MKYSELEFTVTSGQNNSLIMEKSAPVKMLIACFFSCILGIALMAITGYYYLMGALICVLICIFITTPLLVANKISVETACLAPMLLLCFVYTPISWFTFDGLLGCTPYLSILFFTIITLTHYRKVQMLLLYSYALFMLVLTIHWLVTRRDDMDVIQTINILVAYGLTTILVINILEAVKCKNLEANKRIMDLSIRDDLTGLLNRRVIKQVFDKLESIFAKEGAEYATIIIDIDEFKRINDIYGHSFGDLVLKNVSECIQKSIRSTDYAFRYGGDEFLLVLPNMDEVIINKTCDRIKMALCEIQEEDFLVTLSMGCALRSESSTIEEMLELADQRMYQVKRSQNMENTKI